MRWIKIASSLLMLSSSLTANPLLAQGSLSRNLRKETVEVIPPQPTETPPLQLAQNSRDGRIRVVYHEGTDEGSRQVISIFRESGGFDSLAEILSNGLYLPHDLTISLQNCGQANAFYNPITREIVMCIDLLWDAFDLFEANNFENQVNEELGLSNFIAATDVFFFVFHHELGHALIDILDLPVTGKEEDAVDQFSTFLIVESSNQERKNRRLLSIASWFLFSAQRRGDQQPAYWGQHALEQQRMYNIICWMYGSNPEGFNSTVVANQLPGRISGCPREYESLKTAWSQLLAPHNRNSSSGSSTNNNHHPSPAQSDSNRVW